MGRNIEDVIIENNAMLKVLLKNQALVNIVLEETVDKLIDDPNTIMPPEHALKMMDIRRRQAENQLELMMIEIRMIIITDNQ